MKISIKVEGDYWQNKIYNNHKDVKRAVCSFLEIENIEGKSEFAVIKLEDKVIVINGKELIESLERIIS